MSTAPSGEICFYPDGTRRIRSALLVDFDNVFLTLRDTSEEAALHFANEPKRWLTWLAGQRLDTPDYNKFHRRIVAKRCYLNPASFWRFRPFFVRAGFETVDCPPLTLQGKTSADIHMVIDALDLMQQEPRIDEFILLSTDADFTPVLRRIARGDRHIMVLAVGDAAAAYKSACDLLIDQEAFFDVLLGDVDANLEEDTQDRSDVASGPSTVAQNSLSVCNTSPTARQSPRAVIAFLEKMVGDAQRPLSLAGAAAALRKNFGDDVIKLWSERGQRFKDFIEDDDSHHFKLAPQGPGFIYDPTKHSVPVDTAAVSESVPAITEGPAQAVAFARRVHEVTDVPNLTPLQYSAVFHALADEVNAHGYHIMGTPKGARDRCTAMGPPVARAAIAMVMRLVARSGHRFSTATESAHILREKFKATALKLCADAGWGLDQTEKGLLDAWFEPAERPPFATSHNSDAPADGVVEDISE